jgi:hypothetical protein
MESNNKFKHCKDNIPIGQDFTTNVSESHYVKLKMIKYIGH